jgi:toxin ParE1/3/4
MNLIIHEEVKVEINDLVAWYGERNLAAGERLAQLFEEAVCQIAANPSQFPLMEMWRNPGNVRRARLKGYPIFIGYQQLADDVFIFTVAHTSRRPGYWRSRLQ